MKKAKTSIKKTKLIGLPDTIKIKWAGFLVVLEKEKTISTYDSPGDPSYFGRKDFEGISVSFELMRFTYGHTEDWSLAVYFNDEGKGSASAITPQKAARKLMNILEEDYWVLNYFFGSAGN